MRSQLHRRRAGCPPPARRASTWSTRRPRRSSTGSRPARPPTSTPPSRAARAAFPAGRRPRPAERAGVPGRGAGPAGQRADEVAAAISADMGSPLAFARSVQVGTPLAVLASYVDLLPATTSAASGSATRWSSASRSAWSARSRRGTTRCTRSWPRSAAALAAGCTVVLKPSEVAPLARLRAGRASSTTSGLPPGVFNLVSGHRPGGRRGDRRAPGRRHGLLHRLDRGGPAGRRARGRRRSSGSRWSSAASRPT